MKKQHNIISLTVLLTLALVSMLKAQQHTQPVEKNNIQTSKTAATSTPANNKQTQLNKAGKAQGSDFDFYQWQKKYGQWLDVHKWRHTMPDAWHKRIKLSSTLMLENYHINLGPLGVRTLMHDQTWVHHNVKNFVPK